MKTFLDPKEGAEVHQSMSARIWKEEDGIIRVLADEEAVSTISSVREELEIFKKLAGKEKALILGDSSGLIKMTSEARNFVASAESAKVVGKAAGLSHSLTGKLIANFLIKFHKPKVPSKMFSDVPSAMKWLNSR